MFTCSSGDQTQRLIGKLSATEKYPQPLYDVLKMWSIQISQIYRDREQINGCQGMVGEVNGEWLLTEHEVFFCDDEMIWKWWGWWLCSIVKVLDAIELNTIFNYMLDEFLKNKKCSKV
jgi:hypothetical protein